MKRLLLILVFMLNSILLTENAESKDDWDYPVIVYIYGIKFNYQSGHSNDALDIRKNASTDITVPEWWSYTGRNEEFAYIKSQTNRKIKASFCHNQRRTIWDLIIWADEYQNGFGDINDTEISFPGGNCGMSTYFEFTVTGSVPGSIGKRSFYWKWYAEVADPPGPVVWIADTYHDYYTVRAAPQSPMSEPWTEVLDFSCDWAANQSSASSTLVELTDELYSCGVTYDGSQHYTAGGYTNLNLTGLLDDLSNPGNVEMDCRDFSNFLQVLFNSLGGNCGYNRVDRTTSPYYFTYNYLFPAGWASKANPGNWNYHQVGWFNSKVADAATKIDNDADPTSSPHTWKLSVGDMTQSAYINKLTETPNVTSVATGTCTVY